MSPCRVRGDVAEDAAARPTGLSRRQARLWGRTDRRERRAGNEATAAPSREPESCGFLAVCEEPSVRGRCLSACPRRPPAPGSRSVPGPRKRREPAGRALDPSAQQLWGRRSRSRGLCPARGTAGGSWRPQWDRKVGGSQGRPWRSGRLRVDLPPGLGFGISGQNSGKRGPCLWSRPDSDSEAGRGSRSETIGWGMGVGGARESSPDGAGGRGWGGRLPPHPSVSRSAPRVGLVRWDGGGVRPDSGPGVPECVSGFSEGPRQALALRTVACGPSPGRAEVTARPEAEGRSAPGSRGDAKPCALRRGAGPRSSPGGSAAHSRATPHPGACGVSVTSVGCNGGEVTSWDRGRYCTGERARAPTAHSFRKSSRGRGCLGQKLPPGSRGGNGAAVTRRGWRDDLGEPWKGRPHIHRRGLEGQAQGRPVL